MIDGEAHDRLAAAQSALTRCDWEAAYAHARAAAEQHERDGGLGIESVAVADAFDVLAEAAWWVGRLDECIGAREHAYAVYDEAGADRRAGQCAIWLYTHHCFKGKRAIATGWLRRARRALQDAAGSPEYGYLLLYESELAHGNGDLDEAAALARTVVVLGRQLRSPDLEAQALQAIGRVLIDDGHPAAGLAHLDEAMLFATEGRLSPYVTGKIYCSLVSACHDLGDIRRANEWTDAIASWAAGHPSTIFPGLCRLHRADLLHWRGEWALAEAEAQRACGELEAIFVPNAAAAFAQLGEIRRRRGDIDGAEEAFARAEALGVRPAGGLARLRLLQRDAETGSAIIADALAETSGRLPRAWLLPIEVELAIAVGDLERAAGASTELSETATGYDSPLLLAAAATARGRVQLATGDPEACGALRAAVRAWCDLDAPYEIATARVLLGQAYRLVGDERSARGCFAEAETLYCRLGATTDARMAERLSEPAPLPCGLTAREGEVLRLVAAGSTNKQIAAALFLSDKTISRHLSNIFTKIGVRSRAAATAFAFEHRLMP